MFKTHKYDLSLMTSREPASPFLMSGEDDDPDEGGGGGGKPKPNGGAPSGGAPNGGAGGADDDERTFTQSQVEAMMAKRVKEAKLAEKKAVEHAAKLAADMEELKQQLEQIQADSEDKTKGATEKAEAAWQRKFQKLEQQLQATAKEKEDAAKNLDALQNQIRQGKVDNALRAALGKGKARVETLEQALLILRQTGDADIDDKGVVSITLDGVPYSGDKLADGVQLWLAANAHFVRAEPGGSGLRRPGGAPLTKDMMENLSPGQLIRIGLGNGS